MCVCVWERERERERERAKEWVDSKLRNIQLWEEIMAHEWSLVAIVIWSGYLFKICVSFIRSCHSQQMLNVHLCFEMNGDVTSVTDSIGQRWNRNSFLTLNEIIHNNIPSWKWFVRQKYITSLLMVWMWNKTLSGTFASQLLYFLFYWRGCTLFEQRNANVILTLRIIKIWNP